jgi:hypothetical protein
MGGAKEAWLVARSSPASREAGNRGVSSGWLGTEVAAELIFTLKLSVSDDKISTAAPNFARFNFRLAFYWHDARIIQKRFDLAKKHILSLLTLSDELL